MEGKLVAEIIGQLAKTDGLDQAKIDRLQKHVSWIEQIVDGLGFCLSEEGDLLSQWRGYADDATGASIGFSKDYLEQFSNAGKGQEESKFSLQKVEYDLEKQKSLIKPTYDQIRQDIDSGALEFPGKRSLLDIRSDDEIKRDSIKVKKASANLSMRMLLLSAQLFLLKADAFREEQEWRLLSYFLKAGDDTCSFRALNDRIVPFREFKLPKLADDSVVEVILGPKNTTPVYVIKSLLEQSGFSNVNVLHSEASYR
jgi:hypothetical protein